MKNDHIQPTKSETWSRSDDRGFILVTAGDEIGATKRNSYYVGANDTIWSDRAESGPLSLSGGQKLRPLNNTTDRFAKKSDGKYYTMADVGRSDVH
ncbi:hypothetical protein COK29_30235, partial [Bacillus cereus]